MTDLRSSPSGRRLDLAAGEQHAGLQTAWAIDPLTGNDEGPGTVAAPLRTMKEFNARYQGVLVQVNATLQLVGDVVDTAFMPQGVTMAFGAVGAAGSVAFAFGGSLTVQGTKTIVASNVVVSSVTQLGDAGVGFPFQLVTTGVDWTQQPLGAQIRIVSSSSAALVGAIAFIMSVTDANTVILGAFTSAIQTSLTGPGSVTPLATDVLSLSTLSKALTPQVDMSGLGRSGTFNSGLVVSQMVFKDLQIIQTPPSNNPFAAVTAQRYAGNIAVLLFGCEMITGVSSIFANTWVTWVACRFTLVQATQLASCSGQAGIYQSVFSVDSAVKTTRFLCAGGQMLLSRNGHNNCALRGFNGSMIEINGPINIRNTTIPCFFEEFTRVWALAVIGGSTGNLDNAMRIQSGSTYCWNGAASKPTVTGVSPGVSDVVVGGTTMSYAALGTGFYAMFNNASPNSILNLVGPGGGCWMAQF